MQATTSGIAPALKAFAGDPQRAAPLAAFLGFQPVTAPQDQLAGPLRGGLKWFFAQRPDYFGVKELYRVGADDAKPGSVGLWVAVLTEWGLRSTDRDRPRRRIARALVEQVPDARSLVILVPNDLQRSHIIKPGAPLLDVSLHWQQVFSVECVTTRFYQEYMTVRDRMADALLAHNAAHATVRNMPVGAARAWATAASRSRENHW